MNYDELNEYIKHYVEKDKTPSAIMLTGLDSTIARLRKNSTSGPSLL